MTKRFFLYSLVGLVLVGIAFSRTRPSADKGRAAQLAGPVANPDGSVTVGSVRLWRDYQENEVAADGRYKGKPLRVAGTLASIERDPFGKPVLNLVSGNPIFLTMATLDSSYTPAAARLRKGDQVVVRCVGAGVMMRMPQLEKCSLLQPA